MKEVQRTPVVSPKRSNATIYDVAKLAGVSHQTVARYLNGATGLKPDTRSRVKFALRELNYRPNYTARALAHGRSQRIAAITHEIDQVGPSQILIGASRAAREAGYLLDVLSFDADDDAELEVVIEATNMKDTAGILAFASTDHVLARFNSAGFIVPLVVAGETEEARKGGANFINDVGIHLLIDHLQELGHSRFLEIAGPNTWVSARNRSFALETELNNRGCTLTARIEGDWSAESGYAAARSLDPSLRFTAVVASNDQMALGAMLAFSEQGLRIPQDISIVGFDNIAESAYLQPPLTTIGLDFALEGRLAIGRLIEQLNPGPAGESFLHGVPQLLVRESTSRAGARLT